MLQITCSGMKAQLEMCKVQALACIPASMSCPNQIHSTLKLMQVPAELWQVQRTTAMQAARHCCRSRDLFWGGIITACQSVQT